MNLMIQEISKNLALTGISKLYINLEDIINCEHPLMYEVIK
jgi:hypothetical protein